MAARRAGGGVDPVRRSPSRRRPAVPRRPRRRPWPSTATVGRQTSSRPPVTSMAGLPGLAVERAEPDPVAVLRGHNGCRNPSSAPPWSGAGPRAGTRRRRARPCRREPWPRRGSRPRCPTPVRRTAASCRATVAWSSRTVKGRPRSRSASFTAKLPCSVVTVTVASAGAAASPGAPGRAAPAPPPSWLRPLPDSSWPSLDSSWPSPASWHWPSPSPWPSPR